MLRIRYGIWAAAVAWAACESLAWGDDAKLVDDASALLAKAVKAPPTTDEGIERARDALKTLVKHRPEGLSKLAWTLAADERQSDLVRGEALVALRDLPETSAERVRAFALPLLRDQKQSRALRMFAAFVFKEARIVDDPARGGLEEVLLRRGDDGIVQRTCLNVLAETADLARIRALLLRPEVYANPYFGVRIDVCAALAALDVRDRRALEILCTLMTDNDEVDGLLRVPQEAWLSFWVLTGRTHGVSAKEKFAKRPEPLTSDEEIRRYLWSTSSLRRGVDRGMLSKVAWLCCLNYSTASAKRARHEPFMMVRNRRGLQEVAAACRRDILAIEAEWRAAEKK